MASQKLRSAPLKEVTMCNDTTHRVDFLWGFFSNKARSMESAIPYLENHFCSFNHNISKAGVAGICRSPAAVAEEAQPLDSAVDRGCKQSKVRPSYCVCWVPRLSLAEI